MTWLITAACVSAISGLILAAIERRRRPRPQSFAHLTVMAVEQQQALIAYVHASGSGMFWMGKRQIFEHFIASGTTRTVLRAENTDGTPIEMPVPLSEWTHIVEAV